MSTTKNDNTVNQAQYRVDRIEEILEICKELRNKAADGFENLSDGQGKFIRLVNADIDWLRLDLYKRPTAPRVKTNVEHFKVRIARALRKVGEIYPKN